MPCRQTPMIVLLIATLLPLFGCASRGGDVAAPASAAADVPSKKPFTPPAFDATKWSSEEYGFSVHYPSDFAEQPAQDGGLFSAASPAQVPRIDLIAIPAAEIAGGSIDEIGDGVAAQLAELGGGEASVTSSKEVKLQDGVTDALEFVADWTFQGFPLQSVVVGTDVKDQWIAVLVTGLQGGDLEELSEIAYTLYFED